MRNLLLIISSLFTFLSCTQDDEYRVIETEDDVPVLPASADSTGITVGGSDFGFDDDDDGQPTTSIHTPTI